MKQPFAYFSQNPLDRLDQLRRDSDKVYELIHKKNSRFIIYDGVNIIIDDTDNCFFTQAILDELMITDNQLILLGTYNKLTYFAFTFKKELPHSLQKVSLRQYVQDRFEKKELLGVLAQASSLLQWHDTHKFCSSCGNATLMVQGGNRRDCLKCDKEHFPRVDPVVIMLVTFGDECLLGRGYHFKEKFYSCLAGYVESGESFEDAAKREVFEEAGIECKNAKYLLSQPWPFPNTLMIGMHLEATSQTLKIDKHELQDAIWVHKKDLKARLEGKDGFDFNVPSKIAIARNLLEIWVNEEE